MVVPLAGWMPGWPGSRASAHRAEGGEIMARLLAFFQAFPKSGSFSPSFSKESFGGFVGFQGVASHQTR
jgi:hypothetical protein